MIALNIGPFQKHTSKTFPSYAWVVDIINFDGPLISLYRDVRGKEALCCWMDCNRTKNRWCLVPISRAHLRAYLTSTASLLEIYEKAEDIFIFETRQSGKRSNFLQIKTANVPTDYLPEEDSFLAPEACTQSAKAMVKMETENYYLGIDGELFIEDLFQIPKAYQQLYSFHYALQLANIDQLKNKLTQVLRSWKGGIDAVNIFRGLKEAIPSIHRPQLTELRYNSPGHIELNLLPDIARDIETSLENITSNADFKNSEDLYRRIYKFFKAEGIQGFDSEDGSDCRILSQHIELTLQGFMKEFFEFMGWGVSESPFEFVDASNLHQLRMLLAYYRRLKQLRPYVVEGNLTLGASKLDHS